MPEPKVLSPYEREVAIEWMQKSRCPHQVGKLRGKPLYLCAKVRELTGKRVYMRCAGCTDGSLAVEAGTRELSHRIATGDTRTCCGQQPMPVETALRNLAGLSVPAAEAALVTAVEAQTMPLDRALALAAAAGLSLENGATR